MRASNPLVRSGAFTLVEILVAMAILSILMVVLLTMTNQVTKTWSYTASRTDQFRSARDGFEATARRLSEATLNTYLDYVDINGHPRTSSTSTSTFVPVRYARESELRFISGPGLAGSTASSPVRPTHAVFFQAPLGYVSNSSATGSYSGLDNLLNTWGYYIEFNSEESRPSFLSSLIPPPRYRFRLMEMMEPSESLTLYNYTSGNPALASSDPNGKNWFTTPLTSTPTEAHVLAENIVALIILPKLSAADMTAAGTSQTGALAPTYSYDTTSVGQGTTNSALNSYNQLPALLQLTMVAVDESSYLRLQGTSTTAPDLGLNGLFQNVGDTVNPANPGYAQDLQTLENKLQSLKLSYRVFTTTVSIKSAKWSLAQQGKG